MHKKILFFMLSLLMLVIPIKIKSALAQQSIVITQMSLSTSSDKINYFVHEPVYLQFNLTYHGKTTTNDTFKLRLDTPNLNIYYRQLGQRDFLEYGCNRKDYKYGPLKGYLPTTVSPNEEIVVEEVLAFDTRTNKFILDKPGMYEFKAVYKHVVDDPNQWLESATILVEVFTSSDDEKPALKLYSNEYIAKLVQKDTFYSDLGATDMDKAINKSISKALLLYSTYPNSIYSQHLGRALLDNQYNSAFRFATEESNEHKLLKLVQQNQQQSQDQEQRLINKTKNNSVNQKLLDVLTPSSNFEEYN
jgi:hypothetical protein